MATITLSVWSQQTVTNSVFWEESVLRINGNIHYFLKASVEISRYDESHIEYESIIPNYMNDGVAYIPASKLGEIAKGDVIFNADESVTIKNDFNSVTVSSEGKRSSNVILNKNMKLVQVDNIFYVPARIANDLGLTVTKDETFAK